MNRCLIKQGARLEGDRFLYGTQRASGNLDKQAPRNLRYMSQAINLNYKNEEIRK